MSQPTSHPEATIAVLEAPPAEEKPKNGSIPSPVLPPTEPEVAVSGSPVAPPPTPAWALRARMPGHHSSPPAPPQRMPGRSLGPAGRRRSPILVALLSIVTFGVYALFWHHRVNRELGDFDTRMHVRPGRSTLAVTVPWLLGVLVTIGAGLRIVVAVAGISLPFDPHVSVLQAYALLGGIVLVPYLVLLLPFSNVATVMTLERVRMAEDRAGITTDVQLRPVATLCALLVPVAGGLAILVIAQRRLNRVWQTVPATEARITRL